VVPDGVSPSDTSLIAALAGRVRRPAGPRTPHRSDPPSRPRAQAAHAAAQLIQRPAHRPQHR
jgi:hypothetical protein